MRTFSPESQRSTGSVSEYRVIGRAGITAGGAADADLFCYFAHRKLAAADGLSGELPRPAGEVCLSGGVPPVGDFVGGEGGRTGGDGLLRRRFRGRTTRKRRLPTYFPRPERSPVKSAKVRRRARRNCGGRCCSATSAGPPIPACAWWLSPPIRKNLPALEAWCTRNELAVCHPSFDVAGIGAGFSLPAEQLLLITEKELITAGFSREGRTAEGEVPAPVSADPAAVPVPEFSLADLDEGDYAVHIDHGIGIFRGFRTLTSRGVSREVLVIEYADNQILYVPLLQAHKVSRYLGSPGKVTLHRLGGVRWSRDKESARRSVRSYAADMLRLQAMRQAAPGIVFPPDTAETRALSTGVSLQRHAGPAPFDRRDPGRHGVAAADGPAALRRRRLRQDRAGDAGGVQGGIRRVSGGDSGADDGAGAAALLQFPGAVRRLSLHDRRAQPVSFRIRAERDHPPARQRRHRHHHRDPPALQSGVEVPQPRAGGDRRGAAVRRQAQGAAPPVPRRSGCAHHVGDADSADALSGDGRSARPEHADDPRRSSGCRSRR